MIFSCAVFAQQDATSTSDSGKGRSTTKYLEGAAKRGEKSAGETPAGAPPKPCDVMDERCARTIITENMEQSYITGGSGKRFRGDEIRGNSLYEAQVFVNLPWCDSSHGCLRWVAPANWKYWLDVPIRLGVRQSTDESRPVRTPSYNPGLRLFLWDAGDVKGGAPYYFSLGLHHYSNGQDGPSALADGSANTRTGSFNTNYFELAGHWLLQGPIQWIRLELRQHFYGTWEPFQRDQYEKRHAAVAMRTKEYLLSNYVSDIRNPVAGYFKDFRSYMTVTGSYGHGRTFVVKNEVDPSRNVEMRERDKLSATLEIVSKPPSWTDIAWYIRYDYGFDYYNIDFQSRISRVQFGIVSTNSRF